VQQCRANLHVVLCMSPIGDAFRTRLRQFPSLVNCCTIDWFTAWPSDALQTVAEQFLTTVDNVESSAAAIVTMCCAFQSSVSLALTLTLART
jgi:dynein heavy chain